jgi:hypothetical protein
MGLLSRLRGKRGAETPTVPVDWMERHLWGEWEAPRNYIAGEQSYLAALTSIAGPSCRDGYCLPTPVTFVREPDNGYDSNAFRADVNGRHVGYLRRHVAEQLARPLDANGVRTFTVCGFIRGGSTQAPNLGVHIWLDRSLTPGLNLMVPPEQEEAPEWLVPWPPREREVSA